jgi:hypothetical protein
VQSDATFSLHQVYEQQNASGTWIYFEVQNLDEYINTLIDKGIVFNELPNDKDWLWREARLKDPDNNQLIIYFAGNNRKTPTWGI